jgi:hypothetical protein
MAKTRLSSYIRARLMDLAKDILIFPAEQKACDKAYAVAAKVVSAAIVARYPQSDMDTLRKYESACQPAYVYLDLEDSRPHVVFNFREKNVDVPWIARNSGFTFIANEKTLNLVQSFKDYEMKLKEARETKLKDYAALINGVGSLEDVEAVWPEATKVRDKLIGGAVSTLNPDVIERIKADVASRKGKR